MNGLFVVFVILATAITYLVIRLIADGYRLLTGREGMGYGLGGSVDLETGEYSWGGAASTKFWINPQMDLIIVTCTQLMPTTESYAREFKKMVENSIIE